MNERIEPNGLHQDFLATGTRVKNLRYAEEVLLAGMRAQPTPDPALAALYRNFCRVVHGSADPADWLSTRVRQLIGNPQKHAVEPAATDGPTFEGLWDARPDGEPASYRIVRALAQAYFKYDPDKRYQSAARMIAGATTEMGCEVNDDIVRFILRDTKWFMPALAGQIASPSERDALKKLPNRRKSWLSMIAAIAAQKLGFKRGDDPTSAAKKIAELTQRWACPVPEDDIRKLLSDAAQFLSWETEP